MSVLAELYDSKDHLWTEPGWARLGLQDLLPSAGQISMSGGENVGEIVGLILF